jgi:hypothetical protein
MATEKVNPSGRWRAADGFGLCEKVSTVRNPNTNYGGGFRNPGPLQSGVDVSDALGADIRRRTAELCLSEEIGAKRLGPDDIDELIGLGIPREYIDHDQLTRRSPILRAEVSFDRDGRFFDALNDDPDAVAAFVFVVSNLPYRPHEIIAWHPPTGRVASYHGAISIIGRDNLFECRIDPRVTIHPTLLSWLVHGREGAFLVDEHGSLPCLREARRPHFLDPKQGERLRRISHLQNITVESPYAEGK